MSRRAVGCRHGRTARRGAPSRVSIDSPWPFSWRSRWVPRPPPRLPEGIIDAAAAVKADPEAFWGGKGIWEDDRNYCRDLLGFVAASRTPDNFRYADDGQQVSLETLSADQRQIEGSYFIRSGPGSVARPCSVFRNAQAGYNGVACVRIVSYGRPDVFASVYDRTLEDMRGCLLPAGWEQASSDRGPCDPGGQGSGQCIRTFTKDSRFLVSVRWRPPSAGALDHGWCPGSE